MGWVPFLGPNRSGRHTLDHCLPVPRSERSGVLETAVARVGDVPCPDTDIVSTFYLLRLFNVSQNLI